MRVLKVTRASFAGLSLNWTDLGVHVALPASLLRRTIAASASLNFLLYTNATLFLDGNGRQGLSVETRIKKKKEKERERETERQRERDG